MHYLKDRSGLYYMQDFSEASYLA